MKGKSLHSIFFMPKMLRTIGFTEEGIYGITVYLRRSTSANPIIEGTLFQPPNTFESKYHLQKFYIEYNDHKESLGGGCCFEAELDPDQNVLEVIFQLNKFEDRTSSKETQANNQSIKRLQDHERTAKSYQLNKGKIVDQAKLYIKVNQPDRSFEPASLVKKINFKSKNYFSSLVFRLSHCLVGHRLRSLPIDRVKFNKLPEKEKQNLLAKSAQLRDKSLDVNLLKVFACRSYSRFYRKFIYERIQMLQTLKKLKVHLIMKRNFVEDMPELEEIYQLSKNKKVNKNSLMDFYEAADLSQLQKTIYQESYNLSLHIRKLWTQVVELISDTMFFNEEEIGNANIISDIREIGDHLEALREESSLLKVQEINIKYMLDAYLGIPFISASHSSPLRYSPRFHLAKGHILFVFAHGLNGNEYDMSKIKTFINSFLVSEFLVLKNIKSSNGESVAELGKAAAKEILEYLGEHIGITQINFIGFSLGGMILRAALKHIKRFRKNFNMLMTLCTPHLGLLETNNCLIDTGIFYLKSIKKLQNIKELCGEEERQESGNFLEELAKDESLSYIKCMILVGSGEDYQVPLHSSLLSYDGNSQYLSKLQESILKKPKEVHRMKVEIRLPSQWKIDRYLGRNHIYFIENSQFLHYLLGKFVCCYG